MNYEVFEKLSGYEREEFQRIVNDLLTTTFVLKETWNNRDNRLVLNQAYLFIERNYALFQQTSNALGWEIQIYDSQGFIQATSPFSSSRVRLNMFQTYFLYVLRFIYEDKKNDISLSKGVTCSVRDVITRMVEVFRLADRRPGKAHIDDTLQILKKFRIIDVINLTGVDFDRTIIIHPTIYRVVSNEKIIKVRQDLIEQATISAKISSNFVEGNDNDISIENAPNQLA